MILYVLIALIIIILLLQYYNTYEYFSNEKKQELHSNMKKTLQSMNNMMTSLAYKQSTFRTCYPTGSADVEGCFNELPESKADGVYITSVHVGSKFCPWDNGGDPDYWKKMKAQKLKTGKQVWGIVNRASGDELPDWDNAVKCMCLDGKCNDDRKGLFTGLLIDVEGKDMDKNKCASISDLSRLNIPTASVVGNGTCSNYNNPKGHTYIAMCYDGEKCMKNNKCLKNIKGVNVDKYMYSTNEWPSKTLCTPYDIFHPRV